MTVALRCVRLLLLAVAASLAVLVAGTGPALAHDELTGSNPADGATVDAAPAAVELQFSDDVQELGTEVVVTADDGSTVSDGAVQAEGSTVVQPLRADLPDGRYTVEWRVGSADGHPKTGTLTFTVAAGGTDAATPAAPPTTTDVGEASATTDTGSSATPWIVGGAVVVLAGAVAVGLLGLRRRS